MHMYNLLKLRNTFDHERERDVFSFYIFTIFINEYEHLRLTLIFEAIVGKFKYFPIFHKFSPSACDLKYNGFIVVDTPGVIH